MDGSRVLRRQQPQQHNLNPPPAMSSTVTTLNVGGAMYTTTTSTLTRFPSMLASLVTNGMPTTRDAEGHLFIDRDGTTFKHILNYLRSGQLVLPQGFKDLDLLAAEADFYKILPLTDAIDRMARCYLEISEIITTNTYGQQTTKAHLGGRRDVLGTLPKAIVGSVDKSNDPQGDHTVQVQRQNRRDVGHVLASLGWTLFTSSRTDSVGTKTLAGTEKIIERWQKVFDPIANVHPDHK